MKRTLCQTHQNDDEIYTFMYLAITMFKCNDCKIPKNVFAFI